MMKKKFWLTLFSLASALCLCCGLVACGETPKDPDPPAASIEGVWTGATAEVAVSDASDPTEMAFTANVKVVGDTAYVVLEIAPAGESAAVGGFACYALAKQTDGSYSFTYDPENDLGHAAAKLNSENKLEIVSDMTSAAGTEMTLTFTAKAELAAGLGLTGIWYELVGSDGVNYSYTAGENHYDFTEKKLYAFDDEENLTVVEVGKYTVVAYTGHMPQVIYKSGNEYFVDDPHIKLTQTAPTSPTPPATDDPVDGVWTGATGTHTLTATVKIVDDKAYAVIVEQDTTDPYHYTHYRAKVLEKQGDGSYTLTDDTGNYTGALDGDDLVVTMPGSFVGQSDDATVTFSEKQELPAALTISGPYHPADFPLEFNFTTHEVKQSGVVIDGVQFVNVGNYIMIVAPTPGTSEVTLLIVFQKEGTYYYVGGLSQPVALTAGQPA